MRKRRQLSGTPRAAGKKRSLDFSLRMREKISENWVEVRKNSRPRKKVRRKKKRS